ncbi:MAG: MauE/DoxX family redox-associated membrane protein [Verrucomicrobiales bacterium]
MNDLQSFELAIRNFSIVNDPWVAILTMVLPPFELIIGLFIVLRVLYIGSLILVTVILLIFILALTSLLIRDINVDCGCLGLNISIQLQILLDLSTLGGCAYLFKTCRKKSKN